MHQRVLYLITPPSTPFLWGERKPFQLELVGLTRSMLHFKEALISCLCINQNKNLKEYKTPLMKVRNMEDKRLKHMLAQ